MRSRYRPEDAAAAVTRLAPRWGEDLALRVYTSRLLGEDPSLVLHGGGNTSVKSTAHEVTGDAVDVLYVKGSGWDLGRIEPPGFPACRLAPLRRLCAMDALSDDAMVTALRSQMLDPASPTPSVEALLHAFLPGKFVDHTHADAVLALQDQPDARARAAEVWGPSFLFVPYGMPGFALAQQVVALAAHLPMVHGLILEQHGIFTWGATARESYERMIAGVTAAEEWRSDRPARATPRSGTARVNVAELRAPIMSALRGAIARAGDGRFLMEWRTEPAIMALAAREDGPELTARGTVTPDHVIRTKPRPLWLDIADGASADAIRSTCEQAVQRYAAWYREYFARIAGRNTSAVAILDAAPRVVFVPGVGALTLGRSLADARVAGDIIARSSAVIVHAETVGRYHPVSEADLFDVEYWSLEQAKLGNTATSLPLAGRVAFVTGAASGIGLAAAERLLSMGAHLFLSDVASDALSEALAALTARFGARVAGAVCDVRAAGEISATVLRAVECFGGIDVLVSNAGTAPQGLLHTREGEQAFESSLDINLLAHQRVARAVVEVMLAQDQGGCLLFNASKSAVNQGPEFGPYAVPKAGLLALMRQYAVDLGSHGIRSNAVNADRIRTALFGGGVLEARASARGLTPEAYFRQNLLARETTAADVADAFGWLASAEATTGCVITVDGGNAAAFMR